MMRKLKFIFAFVFFVILSQSAYSQVYKFRSTGFSAQEKDTKGKWGVWSPLTKIDLVINLDTDKNRIVVYSQEIQLYNILSYEERIENDEDLIYPFTCQDIDGESFTILIITRKKQGGRKQLYINQKEINMVYNIENILEEKDK